MTKEAISPLHLEAELERARERQAAVTEILRTIAQSPGDVQTALETIAASAMRFCAAEDVLVLVRDGDRLYGRAHLGPILTPIPGSVPFSRDVPPGRALLERRVVHVLDSQTDAEFPLMRNIARIRGHHTHPAVPLNPAGEPLGAILLRRVAVRPFSDGEIEVARAFAETAVIALENGRLFHEPKEALAQQTAISDVLATIGRSVFDLDAVLQTIVERAVSLVGATRALIFTRDGEESVCRAVAGMQVEHGPVLGERAPIDRTTRSRQLVNLAFLEGVRRSVPDVAMFPDLPQGGMLTRLAIPFVRGGEVTGVLVAVHLEASAFSDRDVELLQVFADQAAIAIENVRLFNETKEALAQQTAVSEVLATISRSAFDVHAVMEPIVRRAATLIEAETALVAQRDGDELVTLASYGPLRLGTWEPGFRLPIDDTTNVGRAVLSKAREYAPDAGQDARLPQDGPRTRLAIPFVRDGVVTGVLGTTRDERGPFTESEIRLLEVFADQAAIAIENVRLFNETKEALERQSATGEGLRVIA